MPRGPLFLCLVFKLHRPTCTCTCGRVPGIVRNAAPARVWPVASPSGAAHYAAHTRVRTHTDTHDTLHTHRTEPRALHSLPLALVNGTNVFARDRECNSVYMMVFSRYLLMNVSRTNKRVCDLFVALRGFANPNAWPNDGRRSTSDRGPLGCSVCLRSDGASVGVHARPTHTAASQRQMAPSANLVSCARTHVSSLSSARSLRDRWPYAPHQGIWPLRPIGCDDFGRVGAREETHSKKTSPGETAAHERRRPRTQTSPRPTAARPHARRSHATTPH